MEANGPVVPSKDGMVGKLASGKRQLRLAPHGTASTLEV